MLYTYAYPVTPTALCTIFFAFCSFFACAHLCVLVCVFVYVPTIQIDYTNSALQAYI